MTSRFALFALLAGLGAALPAAAQEKLRVGLVLTLSGPPAALGQQANVLGKHGEKGSHQETGNQLRRVAGGLQRLRQFG